MRETGRATPSDNYHEDGYLQTLNSLGDPMHVVDDTLRIVSSNAAFENWLRDLDYEVDLRGRQISDVFPFLSNRVLEEYQRAFDYHETVVTSDYTVFGGKEIYTETRKIPVVHDGRVVRVVTIIRDITENKLMEMSLEETEARHRTDIERSEQRFLTIFNESPVSICILDAQGTITQANPACAHMFGVQGIQDLLGFNIFGDPNLPQVIKAKMLERESVHFDWEFDFEVVKFHGFYKSTKSGIMNIGTIISPIRNGQGNSLNGWIVQMQDITKYRETTRQLRESKIQSNQYMNYMGHDIANHLQVLVICTQLLENADLKPKEKDVLDILMASLEQCKEIINRARAWESAENDTHPIQ
ncbi:MAG: PAS domain-containing protein [Candidatus Thorarchaeota archaeon]